MTLKLDENLGVRGQAILRAAGHNVATVIEQKLESATDEQLADVCRGEKRILVTLDLDFANTLRFPPEKTPGIAVMRLPAKASHAVLLELVRTLAEAFKSQKISGRLWIVEPGRIRIHDETDQ